MYMADKDPYNSSAITPGSHTTIQTSNNYLCRNNSIHVTGKFYPSE